MKKILLLIVGIVLLSGCSFKEAEHDLNTIYYDLEIGNSYQEKITFTFPRNAYEVAAKSTTSQIDSLEYILLLDNFSRPIHNNLYTLYGKKISNLKNAVEVDLSFNYLEKDFANSNYMNTCFENHKIQDADDYFEVHLSGNFYCLQDKTMNIRVKSEYLSEETNGEPIDDGYQWVIDSSNVNNTDIYYKVYRDKNNMATYYGALDKHLDYNILSIVEFFIIFGILVGGFFFYKFLYIKTNKIK